MTRVRIGLGSNIGDPAKNIATAIAEIARLGEITATSSLYLTKPWGITEQPDFLNAVIELETEQKPQDLLAALKAIERTMGRQETIKWGPRLIDLDILTFGDIQVNEPGLTIPHAHMHERAFVLVPLSEIDPGYATARDALPAASLAAVAVHSWQSIEAI